MSAGRGIGGASATSVAVGAAIVIGVIVRPIVVGVVVATATTGIGASRGGVVIALTICSGRHDDGW